MKLYKCEYEVFKNSGKLYVKFKISDCQSILGQITQIDLLKILYAIECSQLPIVAKPTLIGKHIRIILEEIITNSTLLKLTFISECQRDEALAYLEPKKLIRRIYQTLLAPLETSNNHTKCDYSSI